MSERTPVGWEGVYADTAPRLWRSLVGFTGDPDVAGDAMSEAFAQAMRRQPAPSDPAAWVWRASFRIAAGELKERGRSAAAMEIQPDHAAAPDRDVAEVDRLVRALSHLSPKQRGALVLHHYAGFPVKEVAAIIGSTGPAVRVHLSRGRKRLRELLEDDDA